MRLIAQFLSEKEVIAFSDFLSRNKILNQYEKVAGESSDVFDLWVHQEDDVPRAFEYYQQFVLDPQDPRFVPVQKKEESVQPPKTSHEKTFSVHKPSFFSFSLTYWLLILCGILFVWNGRQEDAMKKSAKEDSFVSEFSLTPLQRTLFFDDPKAMQEIQKFIETYSITSLEELQKEPIEVQKTFQKVMEIPLWKGFFHLVLDKTSEKSAPLFEKIRQGEVWRFVSPAFMHRDFLHIFFNMAWLLILGRQIEVRLKIPRMLLLVLLLAIFSNTSQYLMSGPYFLGFSGVITGLAGFIWSRQKRAPWEGYPLQKTTLLFLFYFVLILFLISIVCFILKAFGGADFASSMANTAHISGGLLGLVLGRCSFFSRRLS